MKKLFLVLLVTLSISYSSFSQEKTEDTTENQNLNEVKLNGLFLVIGAFDIAYERILTESTGLGVNVFLPIDEDISENINYYISPYYRQYFGKKQAAGFFLEGFGMLNSTNNYTYDYAQWYPTEKKETITDFALGIGLGGKWIADNGFIGELNFGVGRNLFNNNETDNEIVIKAGISLGYRF